MAKEIILEDIIEKLDNGSNKAAIQKEYGLTQTEVNKLWQVPELKGRRGNKTPGFTLKRRDGSVVIAPIIVAPHLTQEEANKLNEMQGMSENPNPEGQKDAGQTQTTTTDQEEDRGETMDGPKVNPITDDPNSISGRSDKTNGHW